MARWSFSSTIASPPARTFEVFTDLEQAARTIDGITSLEVLTDAPTGVGTRFRETRTMFGREATEEMEFTEFEPSRRYTVECDSCGAHWTSVYRFTPEGERTRVDVEMTVTPVSLMAKLMSPLSAAFSGTLIKCLKKDLEDLGRAAEGRPASAETASA